jgi:uncharacterized membrane protein YphA (DoxX/SURF4 family)
MKIAVKTIQVIVGVLFIISGLVKANDPLGLSYKMEEFFIVWSQGLASGNFFARDFLIGVFNFLNQHVLALSVIMITLEVLAGIALLIGWKKRFVLYLLLVLIVFFTFLTGYAYLAKHPNGAPKFTNCGCFGDCFPITPWTSFLKDLALLGMIVFLIIGKKHIQPLFTSRTRVVTLAASLLFCLLLQWYVLNYLPLADCLPFKKGNNIAEQMKPPPGSRPDSIAMRFIYTKDGKEFEFAMENLPSDTSYRFKDRIDKVVRKGDAIPKIQGFSLMGGERFDSVSGTTARADSTAIILNQPEVVIGFALSPENINSWLEDFSELVAIMKQKSIPVYFASSNRQAFVDLFAKHKIDVQVFSCDYTNIRTSARTNPAFYHMRTGTIVNKYSYRNMEDIIKDFKQ